MKTAPCDFVNLQNIPDQMISSIDADILSWIYWELTVYPVAQSVASLERSRVLILVKVIGGRQEGHPVQKCSVHQQSPN